MRWADLPDEARLAVGTAPDAVIAQKLGVSTSTVYRWRMVLDVAAWGRVNPYPRRGGREATSCPDAVRDLLGAVPDRVLAARADVSPTTARKWRVAAGIPPCRRHAAPRVPRERRGGDP
jgi:hypothetical protein